MILLGVVVLVCALGTWRLRIDWRRAITGTSGRAYAD
eukprot:COSAG02_NODE_64941_length_259_cov_0.650000_1_plen_36_part_01